MFSFMERAMASLQIAPSIAFLPAGTNTTRPVLRWDITGEPAVYFWFKKNNEGRWRAAIYDTNPDIPHAFSAPTDSSVLGQRNNPNDGNLGVGRYVILGMPDERSPNDNPQLDDPKPLFRIEVVILRDAAALLQDTDEQWGNTGTQIDALARGTVPAKGDPKKTYAVLRVDTMEPKRPTGNVSGTTDPYPTSWLDFPNPDPSSPLPPLAPPRPTSQQGLSVDHHPISIASRKFLPGQKYWALLLVYTEDGEWQVRTKQLKMFQRIVEITFREISISNDGAFNDGRAFFHWWVVDRELVTKGYGTPTLPISDRPSPGEEWKEHIGLSTYIPEKETPLKLGPYSVAEDRFNRCLILTRAIGKHPTGTDDKSGNVRVELSVGTEPPDDAFELSNAALDFPIGSANESFENKRFFVEAANVNPDDDDNEFAYALYGLYSVDYQPEPEP
jgi:hypothetical protein